MSKPKQVKKQKSQTIKKDKENNNDRNRKYIHRFIIEERRRAGKRKRRIAQIVEFNFWAESTDYKYVTEGFERWYRDRRLRTDFEKGIRSIFGNLGGVKQKLAQRNKEILGILRFNSGNIKFKELNENSNPNIEAQVRLRNAEARARNNEKRLEQGKNQTI